MKLYWDLLIFHTRGAKGRRGSKKPASRSPASSPLARGRPAPHALPNNNLVSGLASRGDPRPSAAISGLPAPPHGHPCSVPALICPTQGSALHAFPSGSSRTRGPCPIKTSIMDSLLHH